MTYTASEAKHFYWHCVTAGHLLQNLEVNTATRVHINNALRMATLNAVGKDGIRYASLAAIALRGSQPSWGKLGLIREHVVPVSVVSQRVADQMSPTNQVVWRDLRGHLTDDDFHHWKVMDSDEFLDRPAELSAIIGATVRRLTLLAWITPSENALLKENGLTKTMPAEYGDDLFARYKSCGIELVDLHARAT